MSYLKFSEPKAPTRVHVVTPTEWGNNDAKDYDPTALVAVMKAPDAAVTYTLDPNGGTWDDGTTTSKTVPEGDFFNPSASDPTRVTPNPPKKEGYVCIGWTPNFQTIDEFLEYVQNSAPDPSSVDKADQIVYHLVYDNHVNSDGSTYYAVWAPESVLGIKGSYELVTAEHKLRFVGSITFDSKMRATYTTAVDSWRINQDTILDMFVTYDPELFETPNAIEIHHLATYTVRDRPPYMKIFAISSPDEGYITNEHQDEFMYQDPVPDRECGDIKTATYSFVGSTLQETDTEYKVTGAFNEVEFFLKYYSETSSWKWDVREATHKKTVFKFEYKGGPVIRQLYDTSNNAVARYSRSIALYIKQGWASSSATLNGYIYYKWDIESEWHRLGTSVTSGNAKAIAITFDTSTINSLKADGERHVLTVVVHADWDETATENPLLAMSEHRPWDIGSSSTTSVTTHTRTRNWLRYRIPSDMKLFAIPDYGQVGVNPITRSSGTLQNADTLNAGLFSTCRISRMILGKMKYVGDICQFAWGRIQTSAEGEIFCTAIISAPNAAYIRRGYLHRVYPVAGYDQFVKPTGELLERINITTSDTHNYIAQASPTSAWKFTQTAVNDNIHIVNNTENLFVPVTTSTEFDSYTMCFRVVEEPDASSDDPLSYLPIATVHLYFPKGFNDNKSVSQTGTMAKGSDFYNTNANTYSGKLCDVIFKTTRDPSDSNTSPSKDIRGSRLIQRIYIGGMSTKQIADLAAAIPIDDPSSPDASATVPNDFGIDRNANDYTASGDDPEDPSAYDRTMIFGYDGYFELVENLCLTLDENRVMGIPNGSKDMFRTKIYVGNTPYDIPDLEFSMRNTGETEAARYFEDNPGVVWIYTYYDSWRGTDDNTLSGTTTKYNLSAGWVQLNCTYYRYGWEGMSDPGLVYTLYNLGTKQSKTIYAKVEWYVEEL